MKKTPKSEALKNKDKEMIMCKECGYKHTKEKHKK